MLQDLCIPLTMKAMAFGHSLYEAECIAAMLLLQVVLLCALMGCIIVLPDNGHGPERLLRYSGAALLCGTPAGMRGLTAATAGTAGKSSHPVLRT